MLIKNYDEFMELVEKRNADMLCRRDEVNKEYDRIIESGKECTIVSIQDENDGTSSYLEARYRIVNNLGYYVLEGKIEFENDYIEY